jgi:hypothetical protein
MSNQISYKQNGIQLYQNPSDGVDYAQPDPFRSLSSPNLNYTFPTSVYIKLQPRKVNFQPSTLGNTTHIYTSPIYNDIIALANYFADWSCAYEIQEGPNHQITVQIPWDTIANEDFFISDFASEQWELVPNQDQKSLLYAGLINNPFLPPSSTGNFVVLPDYLKAGVQRAYENKYAFFSTSSAISGSLVNFYPYAQQTLNYMRFGVEGVPSYTQTLKRTAVIDERNTNRAFQTAIDNEIATLNSNGTVNLMMSTPQLKLHYNIPNDTVGQFMYPSYAKQISLTAYDSMQRFVFAGWVIKPISMQFITRNKIQLNQEFIWNEWLQGLYYINSPGSDFKIVVSNAATPDGFYQTNWY